MIAPRNYSSRHVRGSTYKCFKFRRERVSQVSFFGSKYFFSGCFVLVLLKRNKTFCSSFFYTQVLTENRDAVQPAICVHVSRANLKHVGSVSFFLFGRSWADHAFGIRVSLFPAGFLSFSLKLLAPTPSLLPPHMTVPATGPSTEQHDAPQRRNSPRRTRRLPRSEHRHKTGLRRRLPA